ARYLADLADRFPIITIEDGMSESDWDGWAELTRLLGQKIQVVGDDVFVTNTRILKQAIERHIANAILIKPNQIGTLTETLAVIDMADQARYASVVSHRSGETEDSTIADIAVASAASQIENGVREVERLERAVATQRADNEQLAERNQQLAAEVRDLKTGMDALEERARSDLGMIARNETFYQVVPARPADPHRSRTRTAAAH